MKFHINISSKSLIRLIKLLERATLGLFLLHHRFISFSFTFVFDFLPKIVTASISTVLSPLSHFIRNW